MKDRSRAEIDDLFAEIVGDIHFDGTGALLAGPDTAQAVHIFPTGRHLIHGEWEVERGELLIVTEMGHTATLINEESRMVACVANIIATGEAEVVVADVTEEGRLTLSVTDGYVVASADFTVVHVSLIGFFDE